MLDVAALKSTAGLHTKSVAARWYDKDRRETGRPEVIVWSAAALKRAAETAKPHTRILLQPGVYSDTRIDVRAPGVTIAPLTYAPRGARQVIFNGIQLVVSGRESRVGGIDFIGDAGVIQPSNLIQFSSERGLFADCDIDGVRSRTKTTRVLIVGQQANYARVVDVRFAELNGFACVVDEDKYTGKSAKHVVIERSEFRGCTSYYFQAGQYGWDPHEQSKLMFSANLVYNCYSGEIKIGGVTARDNWIDATPDGLNLRAGNCSTLQDNLFTGVDHASRVFGCGHKLFGNVVRDVSDAPFIIHEGSLPEQYRTAEFPNAHHVAATHISVRKNTLDGGERGVIRIGEKQPGKLWTPNPEPGQEHYEPYSPMNVTVVQNTLYVRYRHGVALRKPNTIPTKSDKYPKTVRLNKYHGIKINRNAFVLAKGTKTGELGGAGLTTWTGEGNTTTTTV